MHQTHPLNKPFAYKNIHIFFVVFITLFFSACSPDTPDNSEISNETPLTSKQTPKHALSEELSTIYKETCTQCHTNSSTGAPVSGDTKAWQQILAKGIDATLERAMNGYGGMPPAGQCFECTPEQMIKLINYMSQQP